MGQNESNLNPGEVDDDRGLDPSNPAGSGGTQITGKRVPTRQLLPSEQLESEEDTTGSTMLAYVMESPGELAENLRLARVYVPKPGKGEIRVRIVYVGLNPVDYKRGLFQDNADFPCILGSDIAGIVDQVGLEVNDFKVGDRVHFHCNVRKQYGGFAEYALTTANTTVLIPPQLSFAEAAAVPCAGWTAYLALYHKLKVRSGQTILITGAGGGVGCFAIQLAKLSGLRVIACCSEHKHDFVKRLGADDVIATSTTFVPSSLHPEAGAVSVISPTKQKQQQAVNSSNMSGKSGVVVPTPTSPTVVTDRSGYSVTEGDLDYHIMQLTNGELVDHVLDTVGAISAVNTLKCIKLHGSICSLAAPLPAEIPEIFSRGISVHYLNIGGMHQSMSLEFKRTLVQVGRDVDALIAAKQLRVPVTEEIIFDQIPIALEALRKGQVMGKIVARMNWNIKRHGQSELEGLMGSNVMDPLLMTQMLTTSTVPKALPPNGNTSPFDLVTSAAAATNSSNLQQLQQMQQLQQLQQLQQQQQQQIPQPLVGFSSPGGNRLPSSSNVPSGASTHANPVIYHYYPSISANSNSNNSGVARMIDTRNAATSSHDLNPPYYTQNTPPTRSTIPAGRVQGW